MGIVTQVSSVTAIGSHFSRATAANDEVDDISAPDVNRLSGVAVTVALADDTPLAPIEKTAVAVTAAVAVIDALASLTVTWSADPVDDADTPADATRTRVAVESVAADPASVVCSGPWPYDAYPYAPSP